MERVARLVSCLPAGLLLVPSAVLAASEDAEQVTSFNALDTLWVLMAAILVFFMQTGFGMIESGLVRAKNASNVLMKNLVDFSFAALGFFAFGYAIMFGGSGAFVGTTGWFLVGAESAADGVPVEAFWLFQAVFAGTAATIVSGSVAERFKFTSYMLVSFLVTAFLYPVVGHWVWGGGWLGDYGFHDFAGSTVVHAVGGSCALVAAYLVGPRLGRFREDGTVAPILGHNLPIATLGMFILWVGWYGFNAGSTLGMGDPALVARIALNTTLAPAAGVLTAMTVAWVRFGKPDLSIALNGALGGLVGITAPCAVVGAGSSIAIGVVAGFIVVWGIDLLNKVRIDDPVGAIPVHGFNGVWGTLAVGLFGQQALGSPSDGLFLGGGFAQLGSQALGVVACVSFTLAAAWVMLKAVDSVMGLRVSHETELKGLDLDEHGVESYGGFQIFLTD
ncbi:MAG: ammonium transporter [Deltaproteobacteria bacterium]|nr:ammonium transporter [Deltaproteobacteria bacterium]